MVFIKMMVALLILSLLLLGWTVIAKIVLKKRSDGTVEQKHIILAIIAAIIALLSFYAIW